MGFEPEKSKVGSKIGSIAEVIGHKLILDFKKLAECHDTCAAEAFSVHNRL
jgi:hypothetical protein